MNRFKEKQGLIFKEIVVLYIVLFITGGESVIFYATRTLKKKNGHQNRTLSHEYRTLHLTIPQQTYNDYK